MKNYILFEIIGNGARKPLMFTDLEEAKKTLKKDYCKELGIKENQLEDFLERQDSSDYHFDDGIANTHRKEIEDVLKDDFIKEKNYGEIAEDLQHKLKINSLEESSSSLFLYLDDIKELLAKEMTHQYDCLSNKKRNRIIYLCQNYFYLNLYLSGFLSDCYESHAGKSAEWLIKKYIYWLVTDEKPSMERTSTERNKPSFGNFEQWCDFIEYYIQSRKTYCREFIEISNLLKKKSKKK